MTRREFNRKSAVMGAGLAASNFVACEYVFLIIHSYSNRIIQSENRSFLAN